jgi:hypothetical protein
MRIGFIIFVLFYCGSLFGQVSIKEEDKISRLMDSYTNQSKSKDFIQAWRIQLVTTNDRRKMENVRGKFGTLYPGYKISWKHVSPYYHVQVGAYRTKLELQGFLLQLKQDFPNAIPVMDKIRKTELLN